MIRALLAERFAPATATKMMAAMKGVLKTAWRLGLMRAEDYHRAVDLPAVRGNRLPAGRRLTLGEMTALFENCAADRSPGAFLDAALFAVLVGGGLRRSEAVSLDYDDFDADEQALRVLGKGNKERSVPLGEATTLAVRNWINAVRGLEAGPLFCPVLKNGQRQLRRMTDHAVYKRLNRRRLRAGIKPFTPHDLRRTFSSGMIDGGADVLIVQKILGHADVATTSRYDMRNHREMRKAADLFYVPYVEFAL